MTSFMLSAVFAMDSSPRLVRLLFLEDPGSSQGMVWVLRHGQFLPNLRGRMLISLPLVPAGRNF
jgi:hypothetical protein